MRSFLKYATVSLLMAGFCGPSALAQKSEVIVYSFDNSQLVNHQGKTRIISPENGESTEVGYPELPAVTYRYTVPSDRVVVGIRILDATRRVLPGEFNIYPTQPPRPVNGQEGAFQPADPEAYSSDKPFPAKPIEFEGGGYFRGHYIVEVTFSPFSYIAAKKELAVYSQVDFEFVYSDAPGPNVGERKYDVETLQALKRSVENKADVPQVSLDRTRSISESSLQDSIPLLIVTDSSMLAPFAEYALYKTKRGTNTEVMTVEEIATSFSGADLVHQVRAYIRDCYENKHAEFVLLGADVDIIPGIYFHWVNDTALSDLYYSCLDYDWNENGNDSVAEPLAYGDTVDYYPEVIVGRIPCGDSAEAAAAINKIYSYESDTTHLDYQDKVLIFSSKLFETNDGAEMNQRLADSLPGRLNVTQRYDVGTDVLQSDFGAGYGILINNSHAQNASTFLTRYESNTDIYNCDDLDSMPNLGEFGVFLNYTCYANQLNSTQWPCLAREYILNPNRGGVGYLGASLYEYSVYLESWHRDLHSYILDSGFVRPAVALAEARMELPHTTDRYHTFFSFAALSYLYLGDPTMPIWTAEPQILADSCPYYLEVGTQDFSVKVTVDGSPVESALVCVMQDDDVYVISLTNGNGVATFTGVAFQSPGTASVVATKDNCFAAEGEILISNSCCLGDLGNIQPEGQCDPSNQTVDITDMNVLIDHLFISLTPLCCDVEADLDYNGLIDVTDLNILNDNLFLTLTPLGTCP